MKVMCTMLLVTLFLFQACAGVSGGDVATRVLAAVGCVAALAAAGVQVVGDPMLSGAITVTNVLTAITTIGMSNLPATVANACASTFAYAAQDATGLAALIKNQPSASGPTPPVARRAPAALIAAPKAGTDPVVVTIPLRK